jgi:hypothetical protein
MFSVLWQSATRPDVWFGRVFFAGGVTEKNYITLPDAVAWANDQLGVPKPVVVHEMSFDDGSIVVWREDGKASARVSPYLREKWIVDGLEGHYYAKEQALTAAREYVRGVQ